MDSKELKEILKEFKEKNSLDYLEICLYDNKFFLVGRANGVSVINEEDTFND